ncbi:MAG TPA: chromate efflux transporter [Nevskiaceae bacterium]|nr:chromate efflux transporter [Nevskiaceae bacterium]
MSDVAATSRPAPVSFGEAFRYWLKLGCISFGGPAGQIAIMHAELVEKRRWISERRFLHALNYCMLLPGPEAQQLATYIGWLMHGTPGGIVAGALFVLPSLLLLIALTWIYLVYGSVPVIAGVLWGIKPAVVAIVAFAAYRIGSRALTNGLLWLIAAASLVATMLQVPFPLIVFSAGVIGFVGGKVAPRLFATGGHGGGNQKSYGASLIDDDTPTPAHARFSPLRLARVLIVGLVLWSGVIALLSAATLKDMGWFFSKAALLTFGGAYAVLPYVFQGSVLHYGWLSAPQMMDGLALGESTPGPLIMIVAFVGFVGGWNAALFGPEHLVASGAIAASVATYFTFLPSFVFILAGGPLVERTHDDLRFTAPLTAITAAVVGVILNLARFFGYHVFWPQGFGVHADWAALAIGAGAFIALYRFKAGIIKTIAICGGSGAILHLLG